MGAKVMFINLIISSSHGIVCHSVLDRVSGATQVKERKKENGAVVHASLALLARSVLL